jgi:hypothetical protein
MFASFTDWLDHAREQLMDSVTCDSTAPDPLDVLSRMEEQLVASTGFNLNGKEIA